MRRCAACGRDFPTVAGAAEQVCPHCGHEHEEPLAQVAARARRADPMAAARHGLTTFVAKYPVIVALWLPVVLFDVGAGLGLARIEDAMGLPCDPALLTTGQQMQQLGVALPLLLASGALRFAMWQPIAGVVLRRAGRKVAPGSWSTKAPGALALGLLLTVVYMAGFVLLIVPLLIFFHWFLHAPALQARDGRGAVDTLGASRAFARRHGTVGFTTLVALAAIAVLGVGLVSGGLGAACGTGLMPLVGPAIVLALAEPILPTLAAAYVAVAPDEHDPDDWRRSTAEASTPATATTTCPHCGGPVDYTPSQAGATEVVCGSCGRTGKVLAR